MDINKKEKYYQTLEIELNANLDEIQKAKKVLLKVWHPDRFSKDIEMKSVAEKKCKEINAAYDAIMEILKSNAGNTGNGTSETHSHKQTHSSESYSQQHTSESEPYHQQYSSKEEKWDWVPVFLVVVTVIQIVSGILEMMPWWMLVIIAYFLYRYFLRKKQ